MKDLCETNQQLIEENETYRQKLSLLQVASGKKIYGLLHNSIMRSRSQSPDSPFEYIPPKPKVRRRTTARAPTLNPCLNLEDIISESEECEEVEAGEEDEWIPVKHHLKGPRKSALGCSCKGRCGNKMCGCRRLKQACREGCSCDFKKCRNQSNDTMDCTTLEDRSKESEMSLKLEDPTEVTTGESFFNPPCITPTKKVLSEISDIGQVMSIKLQRRPNATIKVTSESPLTDAQENHNQSILKRKKKALGSNSSFFAGCTPIKEDE